MLKINKKRNQEVYIKIFFIIIRYKKSNKG